MYNQANQRNNFDFKITCPGTPTTTPLPPTCTEDGVHVQILDHTRNADYTRGRDLDGYYKMVKPLDNRDNLRNGFPKYIQQKVDGTQGKIDLKSYAGYASYNLPADGLYENN